MKKRISILMISAAMVISAMTSCSVQIGGGSGSNNSSADNSISSTADNKDNSKSSEENSKSSDLFSFKVSIDGNEYKLPCAFSEFKANGWEINGEDGSIKPNTKLLNGQIKKGDMKLYVQLLNTTSETLKYSECAVSEITVNLTYCPSITLPGNFVFDENTTVEDVIAKYGEPTEKNDYDKYDTYSVLTYKKDVYQSVKFTIYSSESSTPSKYNSVSIENIED